MKIALINGSPKGERSASRVLLRFLQEKLAVGHHDYSYYSLKTAEVDQSVMDGISAAEILVIALPIYVDGIPSHLLPWLLKLEDFFKQADKEKPLVYALVNCGFYEPEHTEVTLDLLKNWCKKAKLRWGQGIGIGAGGVIVGLKNVPLGRWPFRRLNLALKEMVGNIDNYHSDKDLFVRQDFPKTGYKIVAEFGWRRAIKRNGLRLKELHRKMEPIHFH